MDQLVHITNANEVIFGLNKKLFCPAQNCDIKVTLNPKFLLNCKLSLSLKICEPSNRKITRNVSQIFDVIRYLQLRGNSVNC